MKIDKIDSPVYVGRLGEKGVLSIGFDVSDWLTQFPTGTFSVDFKPDYLSESFSLPPTQYRVADGVLTIDIEANITGKAGRASLGIRMLVGDSVDKRSAIIPVVIAESLPPATGEMPEPVQAWIDGATIIVGQATAAINTANNNVIVAAAFAGDDIVFTRANAENVVLAGAKPALKGDTGADSVVPGPKGDKGEQGIQGDQGPKGDKGETGLKGEIGLTGDKGDKGDTGADGIKGDTGASITSAAFVNDDIKFTRDDATSVVLANAREILKGDPSVYVGDIEPTDPAMKIWIDEDAQQEYSTTYEQAVDNGYTKSKEQFFADLEGLEGAADLVDSKLEDIGTAISNTNASALAAQNNLLWRRLTTNPASFYPVPQSPLYVRASGEPIQEGIGDPAPDNIRPITPWLASGASIPIRNCGKNMMNWASALKVAAPGTVVISSTGISSVVSNVGINTRISIACESKWFKVGSTYTISLSKNFAITRFRVGQGNTVGDTSDYLRYYNQSFDRLNYQFTIDALTMPYILFNIYNASAPIGTNYGVWDIQIELSNTATPYEPYSGEEITLTAPQDIYGGWMDNEGRGQVTWAKKVFDGTEAWTLENTGQTDWYYSLAAFPTVENTSYMPNVACSHYKSGAIFNSATTQGCGFTWQRFRVRYGTEDTVANWKAFLAEQNTAGTPVTVYYQLATPVTLTPAVAPLLSLPQADRITPRLNVVATDAQGLQTDYAESPIYESSQQNAAIVATGV